jgi:hypothetical protein
VLSLRINSLSQDDWANGSSTTLNQYDDLRGGEVQRRVVDAIALPILAFLMLLDRCRSSAKSMVHFPNPDIDYRMLPEFHRSGGRTTRERVGATQPRHVTMRLAAG